MSYPVVGVIWLWVYNYDWGMANLVLRAVGLGDYAQAWLASPATALPALILVTTWMFAGFNMVVLLAAIHAIPADYLDAARVDGAGAARRVVHVLVPLLRPTLVNLAILDFIGKMKQFALVWVMTRGGPMWGTETVATYVVKRAFEWKTLDLGYPVRGGRALVRDHLRALVRLHAPAPAARGAGVLSVRGRAGALAPPRPRPRLHRSSPRVRTSGRRRCRSARRTRSTAATTGCRSPPTGTSTTGPGPSSATRPTSGTARS